MRKKEKKKKVKSEEGEGIGSRQVKPAGCCRVLADGKSCGTWYGKMEGRECVGRSSRKRFYWKAELDAAGFICAEENDK